MQQNGNIQRGDNTVIAINDPLSVMVINRINITDDPLRNDEVIPSYIEISRQVAQDVHLDNLNTPWLLKKRQILKDYSVTGHIFINSSAIDEIEGSGVEDGSDMRHINKYNRRLDFLERRKVSERTVEMSQQECEAHISKLARNLSLAWSKDERVGTLKIAIQLAKLLADTTFPEFYPSMFVLVTNELERFGSMVFQRIISKSEEAYAMENKRVKHNESSYNW